MAYLCCGTAIARNDLEGVTQCVSIALPDDYARRVKLFESFKPFGETLTLFLVSWQVYNSSSNHCYYIAGLHKLQSAGLQQM